MHKVLTEAIGTFFLVLTIGLTVVGEVEMAPVAIGAVLIALIYMGGHVSGAHYNPAISIALWMRGAMKAADFIPYVVAQFVGAILAAIVTHFVRGTTYAPAPGESATMTAALLIEILFTFALGLVILSTATASATSGNWFYGLAIGLVVMAGAFAGGPISGGVFNPAVGIGPLLVHTLMGHGGLGDAWLYVVGPVTGAALSVFAFRLMHPNDR